jgi:hypothetical protein
MTSRSALTRNTVAVPVSTITRPFFWRVSRMYRTYSLRWSMPTKPPPSRPRNVPPTPP